MELLVIKLCVIVGLLLVTFCAACLPLIFLLPFLRRPNEYTVSVSSRTGFLACLTRWFPCLKRVSREGRLSTSTEFSDDNTSDKLPDTEQGVKTVLFLDLMNCFSGGVFLGTCFLGMMPEIREIFDEAGITWPQIYSSANSSEIVEGEVPDAPLMPITEILVTCGLFLILCIEQIIHTITDRTRGVHKSPPKENSSGMDSTDVELTENGKQDLMNRKKGRPLLVKVTSQGEDGEEVENEVVFNGTVSLNTNAEVASTTESDQCSREHEGHHNDSVVRSLILLLTLSIHSILEGLAIGLQKNISSALSIFVAVLFHKSLMAFSMGNNLVQTRQSPKAIVSAACILAATSPTGIAVGIFMKESNNGTEVVNASLQAIATGTFLFITFFEVLSKEFASHSNRVIKTLSFVVGYLCILGVMFLQHGA